MFERRRGIRLSRRRHPPSESMLFSSSFLPPVAAVFHVEEFHFPFSLSIPSKSKNSIPIAQNSGKNIHPNICVRSSAALLNFSLSCSVGRGVSQVKHDSVNAFRCCARLVSAVAARAAAATSHHQSLGTLCAAPKWLNSLSALQVPATDTDDLCSLRSLRLCLET